MAGSERMRDGLVGAVLTLYKRGLSRGGATCALPLMLRYFELSAKRRLFPVRRRRLECFCFQPETCGRDWVDVGAGHVRPSGAGRNERRLVKNRTFFPRRGRTCPDPAPRAIS